MRIAKELLGKLIVTSLGGEITSARIVEVEAYNGEKDRASHAFGGRRTKRTEIMYADAGRAYVYLCYGIHHLFNVVTNASGIPHAICRRLPSSIAHRRDRSRPLGPSNRGAPLHPGRRW